MSSVADGPEIHVSGRAGSRRSRPCDGGDDLPETVRFQTTGGSRVGAGLHRATGVRNIGQSGLCHVGRVVEQVLLFDGFG